MDLLTGLVVVQSLSLVVLGVVVVYRWLAAEAAEHPVPPVKQVGEESSDQIHSMILMLSVIRNSQESNLRLSDQQHSEIRQVLTLMATQLQHVAAIVNKANANKSVFNVSAQSHGDQDNSQGGAGQQGTQKDMNQDARKQ